MTERINDGNVNEGSSGSAKADQGLVWLGIPSTN